MRKKTIAFPLNLREQFKNMFSKMILMGILILAVTLHVSAKSYSPETKINHSFDDPAAGTEPQQQRIITGKVTGADKLPLPGVTVKLKGSAVGALTDADGKFSIPVPGNDAILEFSFIGMTNQEIVIGPGNVYDVVLSESTIGLDEVVVVGYGIQKKESVVGAITQVNSATLMQSGTATVTNTISGKLSGVLTIQQTGQPGNDQSEIIIRGLSSWNSSAPLVLVDGIERDFKDIDPNEINTVSILKDASATAVFGAKGANGVIIVTTKRGSLGKPSLNFSASYGMEKATRIPDHISSYTTMTMLNNAKMNGQQFSTLIPDNVLEEYRNPLICIERFTLSRCELV